MKAISLVHHKCGNVYAQKVFKGICLLLDRPFWKVEYEEEPENWAVAHHSHPKPEIVEHLAASYPAARFVHFVRRPQGLILSATRCHCDAAEGWLDEPKEKFDGRTYRQELLSRSTLEEKVIFEMQNSSWWVISEMLSAAECGIEKHTVRLEDLARDRSLETYFRMLRYIGLEGKKLLAALQICVEHALWAQDSLPKHSRGGVGSEWKDVFTGKPSQIFDERYGGFAERLGYQ
jgi:hypothetical protein